MSKKPGIVARGVATIDHTISQPGRYAVSAAAGAGAGATLAHYGYSGGLGVGQAAGAGAVTMVAANAAVDLLVDKDEYDAQRAKLNLEEREKISLRVERVNDMLLAM